MSLDCAPYLTTFLVAAVSTTSGCASIAPRSTNYESCATSTRCVVHGIATVRAAERAQTAQFDLPDGRCIDVSLPPRQLETLRRDGPTEMTVTGEVYRDAATPGDEVVLEIEGRTIGFGRCGDFVVFVPDRQDALLANSASEPAPEGQSCVRTSDQISLQGQVRFENAFGPPGFGENPARDQRRTVPILVLDRPIDICPGTTDEIDDASIARVRRLQLIYSHGTPRQSPGRTFVTGELQRATNAFHATPVTLIVDAQR